ncbi:venom carboxylesterase-6-like isoform X2 [Agrilus planipennis]|nr:venom carboxylesterase-6-like isoform X2 [Agrilus planipennis]XP_018325032.1 venom carboxylesterase-6-like isoform X2 [Agrilus planipennis]XP_018325033.1 venom carboxylesterase-6-like isoform X2 [Agrilus planipennis]
MNKMYKIVTLLVILCITQSSSSIYPEIETRSGWVRGITLRNTFGTTYHAFKGIPYAEAPVGELRFKAPKPISRWEETLNATQDKPPCIQKNTLFINHSVEGEEDCLYLNVYTTSIPRHDETQGNAVLVYIHYGGFFAGSGDSSYHGPEYFMNENVTLVTFNYRLGVFGFLSTNDDVAPGNWALKDQTAVLNWVQDNICYFGGDRDRVTIFGQSAGAASVHLHMLSPLSKGLFHRAISQSGTALSAFARPLPEIPLLVARAQAAFVGCDGNANTSALVDCLRNIDARVLVKSVDYFKFFGDQPSVVFMPSIEKRTSLNPHPFITQDPIEIIKSRNFNNVPWIVGFVQNEGLITAAELLRKSSLRNELISNFDSYCPQLLGLNFSTFPNQTDFVWTKIKDFYLEGNTINVTQPSTLQGFINLYGDRFFNYPGYKAIDLHLATGLHPIWVYSFNYKGEYSYVDHFARTNEGKDLIDWGVCHCDDLLYLFSSPALFKPLKYDSNDMQINVFMTKAWARFAKYGIPQPYCFIRWPSANKCNKELNGYTDFCYLNMTGSYETRGQIFTENNFFTNRLRFWSELPLFENFLYDV